MLIQVHKTVLLLDTVPLLPKSVAVYRKGIKLDSGFSIDLKAREISFENYLFGEPLDIFYRVLPLIKFENYRHKQLSMIEPEFGFEFRSFYNYKNETALASPLFGEGLNVSGNIARGLGFGNNQDLILNSNLNLQLNGNLGKGVSILAAISDENNPIQPQGNTQQIQDFDKVFISITKDSNTLTVGDFLMNTNKDQYFMKFYKKSRGLQMVFNDRSKVQQQVQANAAVSRGKFVRNEIQGQEGVQGPYRLQGANSESNIIVISGTESVFLDGGVRMGFAILGSLGNNGPEGGVPFTLSADSIIFDAKYDIQTGDSANVYVILKNSGIPFEMAVLTIGGSQSTWKRHAFKINPLN